MPDYLYGERLVYNHAGGVPWHSKGTPIHGKMLAREAWDLIQYPVQTRQLQTVDGVLVDWKVIQGGDPLQTYGIVPTSYVVIPPEKVCSIADEIVGEGIETIGAVEEGKTFFLTYELPDYDVRGDQVKRYLFVDVVLDGTGGIHVRNCDVRVVCWNTVMAARDRSTQVETISHTRDAHNSLRKALTTMYVQARENAEAIREVYEVFAQTQVKPKTALDVVANTYPLPTLRPHPDPEVMESREKAYESGKKRMESRRELVLSLFDGRGIGMDLPAAKGTAWGLYNAVVEAEDYTGTEHPGHWWSIIAGERFKVKERAYKELVEVCR